MKNKNKLYVISGSSGVGKGTVLKAFLNKNPEFCLSISHTTREKRDGEIEGVNYFYVSKEEFKQSVKNKEFLEWAEFSGNYYGTKKEFIKKCLDDNKDLLLEIDTQGALQVKMEFPKTVLIFIAPPSYQDLEYRLRNRNTESDEEIQKRLDFVKFEIENSRRFDYIVVNDKLSNAVEELERIVRTERAFND